jgi:site-specific DNA recombinase
MAVIKTEAPQGLTAVIYLRVSTNSQVNKAIDPEGYSIPAQRERCEQHAAALGAVVLEEYVEKGRSGTNRNRPELKRMLADLPRLKPSYVIFYDLSRSARDEFDAFWLLREITDNGAKLESTQEKVDDSDDGMLRFTLHTGFNAYRSRNDGKKAREGLERKFLAGGHMGPAPMGYRNDKLVLPGREVRVVVVDDENTRADMVRDAFEMYATGNYTVSTLTDILEVRGLRWRATPKKPERPMSRASVYRMLRDDFYIGIVTFKGRKQRGVHDALIEETTFERVQQILKAHATGGDRGHKHDHFLIGRIFICDCCECRLGYGQHRGKAGTVYEYFSCLSRVRPDGPCGARYLNVSKVEAAVVEHHAGIRYTPEQQERLCEMIRDFVSPRVESAKKQADQHRRRLEALKAEQKHLIQLSLKGQVDDEVLAEEQERIRVERGHARQLVAHATHEFSDIMETLDEALSLVDDTFPYREADDPVLWELINQATHLEIRPHIDELWDGNGTAPVRVRGYRDPFYDAADEALGIQRPNSCLMLTERDEGDLEGDFVVAGVRSRFPAPRSVMSRDMCL